MNKQKNPILSLLISRMFFLHLLYLGKWEWFLIVNILFFGIIMSGQDPMIGTWMLIISIISAVPLTAMYNHGKL